MTRRKPRHKDLPFPPAQVKLLDNVLDELDRLFDDETTVTDVQAILSTTATTMADTEIQQLLASTSEDLLQLIRSDMSNSDDMRIQALKITDPLRHRIAKLLPFP